MWTLKILFFQQRKLKWKKVRGAILSSMDMSTADIKDWRGGEGEDRGYKQREEEFQGRNFGLGFTLLKCFFVLIYKLTLISCNVSLQAVKINK